MTVTIFSWIIIFFTLLSFGDILLTFYNKVCKRKEEYNLLEKMLLGLCFISIPLSIWSLILPSNHVFLFVCIIVSTIYWLFNKRRFRDLIKDIYNSVKELTLSGKLIILLFVLILLTANSWEEGSFDSLFYHHQNIRWNEEFAIVPGLANLDHRMGFNSNYLLLSSIFSFRFLFGEMIHSLDSLFILAFFCWIVNELFKSGFQFKRILVLFGFILFYLLSIKLMLNTTTDLLPNLIILYLVSKYIFYPNLEKKDILLLTIVLIYIVTLKLSFAAFAILAVLSLVYLVRNKEYKTIIFIGTLCFLIGTLWLIRNIILTGYLIFPLAGSDLLDLDWKLPLSVVVNEKKLILSEGIAAFLDNWDIMKNGIPSWDKSITIFIFISTCISFIFSIVSIIRKKISPIQISLYLSLLCALTIWAINGPSFRFVSGMMPAFFILCVALSINNNKERHSHFTGILVLSIFLTCCTIWTSWRVFDRYRMITNIESEKERKPFVKMFISPYSYYDFYESFTLEDINSHFTPYKLNNGITIYIAIANFSYDKLPVVKSGYYHFVNYECIEARGYSLQDGFRVKVGCE